MLDRKAAFALAVQLAAPHISATASKPVAERDDQIADYIARMYGIVQAAWEKTEDDKFGGAI